MIRNSRSPILLGVRCGRERSDPGSIEGGQGDGCKTTESVK